MIARLQKYSLFTLGFGLPLHGLLTVFTPDLFRWWKEFLLLGLALSLLKPLLDFVKREPRFKLEWGSDTKTLFKTLRTKPACWAFLFLLWGGLLVLLNADLHTSFIAYRYLAFGFFAFILGYLLWKMNLKSVKNGYSFGLKLFHNFCTGLLLGVLLSTLLGVWAKFFGGFVMLNQWYSQTISSWVPGQTIPIYHQVGDFIRLQGASSGPVEYGHLAVLALWYVLNFKAPFSLRMTLFCQWIVVLLLLFGIVQSGSRAALLGALILLMAWGWLRLKPWLVVPRIKWTADKGAALLLVVIVLTTMVKFTLSESLLGQTELLNKNIVRISDIDHINRPIEAFKKALESPIVGNLGELGPAARAKNLAENNDDSALIAESVPFDVLAQLGLVGFIIWFLFFMVLWRQSSAPLRSLLLAFTPLMLLATIFDMTPVSISFFLILGLGLILPQVTAAQKTDFYKIFKLKKLAFKNYVEAVWGWREPEQKKFVAQELDQGNLYLLHFDNQTVGTYSLVRELSVCQVYSFYIHPDFQSRGLGGFVLNQIFPAQVLCLQVLKVNSLAKAFYESHGFQVVGDDAHHWHLKRLA